MRTKTPVWIWAIPVFTCGFLAMVGPFAIALKSGTKRAWTWCIGSAAATVLGFVLIVTQPDGADNIFTNTGASLILINLVASTIYSAVMAQQVEWGPTPVAVSTVYAQPTRAINPNDAAIAGVRAARQKRVDALAIAHRDPKMARDLRIGRPDLPRQYDDGGLVDVNSAPAETMTRWLGLSPTQVAQVVDVRQRLGGFQHADDLMSLAALDLDTYEKISDRIVLL